jgi:raffinose/stachyose/melibiose transport system permease protein
MTNRPDTAVVADQTPAGRTAETAARVQPGRPRPERAPRWRLRARRAALFLFALPGLAIYTMAIVYPGLDTLYTSLFNWNILSGQHTFIGLGNYTELFGRDATFHTALENTAIWTVVYVPGVVAAGLAVALWLNREFRGRTILRIVFYLPFVLSNVAAGLMWTLVYYPSSGFADYVTTHIGLGDVQFLADPSLALFSVLAAFMWQGVGAMMIIFLAGLQGIPKELYEVAEVYGVRGWRRLRQVTIPLLRESFIVAGSLALITSLNVFNIIYVMTQGGPGDATQVLGTLTYFDAFEFGEFGQGSAVCGVLVIIVLILGVSFVRRTARERYVLSSGPAGGGAGDELVKETQAPHPETVPGARRGDHQPGMAAAGAAGRVRLAQEPAAALLKLRSHLVPDQTRLRQLRCRVDHGDPRQLHAQQRDHHRHQGPGGDPARGRARLLPGPQGQEQVGQLDLRVRHRRDDLSPAGLAHPAAQPLAEHAPVQQLDRSDPHLRGLRPAVRHAAAA